MCQSPKDYGGSKGLSMGPCSGLLWFWWALFMGPDLSMVHDRYIGISD